MIELAFVFGEAGNILHWHEPLGCTSGSIPDDRNLWDVLWSRRNVLGGVAHIHPGSGMPQPSHTDVTTFSAIERALGRHLMWPIATSNYTDYFVYNEQANRYIDAWIGWCAGNKGGPQFVFEPHWLASLDELRRRATGV